MDFTLYLTASSRASSTLTLPIFALTFDFAGELVEDWADHFAGPHHSAQKSTRTGRSESMTSDWKFASVRLVAMRRSWNGSSRYVKVWTRKILRSHFPTDAEEETEDFEIT